MFHASLLYILRFGSNKSQLHSGLRQYRKASNIEEYLRRHECSDITLVPYSEVQLTPPSASQRYRSTVSALSTSRHATVSYRETKSKRNKMNKYVYSRQNNDSDDVTIDSNNDDEEMSFNIAELEENDQKKQASSTGIEINSRSSTTTTSTSKQKSATQNEVEIPNSLSVTEHLDDNGRESSNLGGGGGHRFNNKIYYDDNLTVSSLGSNLTQQLSTDGSLFMGECYAPPGKVGIAIDTINGQPVIHRVRDDSSMVGVLRRLDIIVGVDDVDTSSMTAAEVTKLMAGKMDKRRKIRFLRGETATKNLVEASA